jgi:hypothetical protein
MQGVAKSRSSLLGRTLRFVAASAAKRSRESP